MKRVSLFVIVLSFFVCFCLILVNGCGVIYRAKRPSDIIIQEPDSRLPSYERLVYNIKWLGLSVGKITSSIKGIEKKGDKEVYVLEVTVKTNPFCSAIYKIEDRFISYMDVNELYTLRHEVYRREGRYKKDAITDFDQLNNKAYFKNFIDNSEKVFDIPPRVQDTLSACYYFRLLSIKLGDSIKYAVYNNEDNYNLFGLIESKTFINLPRIGRSAAFHMQPYAELNGERVKKGKLSVYFSCDKKRLPLLVIIEAPLFTKVIAYLYEIEYEQI